MIKAQRQLEQFFLNREKRGQHYKIKNIVVFSHGYPHTISLNYKEKPYIDIKKSFINKLKPAMFAEGATFFSYACRTGTGTIFESGTNPDSDDSLAQYIANNLQIKVRAFYRRSHYGAVLRYSPQSREISKALKDRRAEISEELESVERAEAFETEHRDLFEARQLKLQELSEELQNTRQALYEALRSGRAELAETYRARLQEISGEHQNTREALYEAHKAMYGKDQDVIDLPPEHEALLHYGLGDGFLEHVKGMFGGGTVGEGVHNYALWRKQGARALPVHAQTPEGFPTDFATFEPQS